MKDKQKIYIKGSIERGNEVIKYLENSGGCNSHCHHGIVWYECPTCGMIEEIYY